MENSTLISSLTFTVPQASLTRCNPELGLFQSRRAPIQPIFEGDIDRNWMRLPVQSQIPVNDPMIGPARFHLSRVKVNPRIVIDVKNLSAPHRLLDVFSCVVGDFSV